ncbi:MAG: hypothetical protein ACTSPI_00160 [Candidatus Heimdallarchaeaceae archaeon]
MSDRLWFNQTKNTIVLKIDNVKYTLFPKGHHNPEYSMEIDNCQLTKEQSNHPSVLDFSNRRWIISKPVNVLDTKESVEKVVNSIARGAEERVSKIFKELDGHLNKKVKNIKLQLDVLMSDFLNQAKASQDKISELSSLIDKMAIDFNLLASRLKKEQRSKKTTNNSASKVDLFK